MKSLKDQNYRPRPTTLRGTRGTCNTTQNSFWCLVTLPKLSHILLLRLVAMRPFLTLVAIVVFGSAQAQFRYSYGPYAPRDQPYGGQYIPPALARSPASIAQAMLDAHNAIRARVGVRPLVWYDQLARVAQDWANHLIAKGSFGHRPNNQYGENANTNSGSTTSPAQVSATGPERRGITMFAAIPAPAFAATTRRSCGHDKSRWHRSAARGLGV
jgi:hypothetical protein